jgi:hypothetical protein
MDSYDGRTAFWIPAQGGDGSGVISRLVIFIFAATLFCTSAIPAHAQQEVSPQAVLMVANVAGECDVLFYMVEFQKKNNINGGNEYVAKFWSDEAARLGMTVEQMSARCSESAAAYNKLWTSTAQKQEGPADGNE